MKTQMLVDDYNNGILQYGIIEKGRFENDPNTECYRITAKDGNLYYAVAQGFTPYEVEEEDIPENFYDYLYQNGEFVKRPVEISDTDRLEAQVVYTAMMTDTLLEVE